ncbi:hypothetical protein Q0590_30535 [Rhodocytophaga aerolata]|uniref:Lipoprotein n=1 Tax=Rhodocytophaga aerolata TaxID=455078 RepID=A0ABT8REW5_9BACT|nr:hypothetical protein [Rhodocytophaga aerolata]MDO1450650.1 hypothetical protein [Rhodocytophaga aerolata]
MKYFNKLVNVGIHAIIIGTFCVATIGCSTNKTVTREDVDKNIEEAREATQEAKEQTQQAIETRKEFTADSRENKITALEKRIQEIEKRVDELKKIAKDSPNQSATENVNQAINDLQVEKNIVTNRIEQVKSIEEKDWSTAYTEIDEAVKKIENTLTNLTQSLKE